MNKVITTILLTQFKEYLAEEEKSENTIQKYIRDIQKFMSFANGKEITKTLTLDYKKNLLNNHSVASSNSMIAALNTFLRYIGWTDCCIKQYKVQRSSFSSNEKELSKGEYLRLIKAAKQKGNDRLNLIIQTICSSGIRVSELKYITVESLSNGKAVINNKGKIRTIFIANELRRFLLKYVKRERIQSGSIFITRSGKPINRSNIWRAMKTLCQTANVDPQKVFPHNLRHLFARTFYNLDRDIAKLADILGHSSINTTRIYIMTTCAEHQKKMDKLKLVIT